MNLTETIIEVLLNEHKGKTKHKHPHDDDEEDESLDIEGLDRQQQIDIWKHCSLREDFISYFPDYEEMIKFVKERVISKEFQKYLIKKIEAIENDFLMGNIDSDEALRKVKAL